MKVDVRYRPAYALAMVTLDAKETIQVESGAMVGMSPDLEMETEARGGFLKSLSRSMFGGESFFLNSYTAASMMSSRLISVSFFSAFMLLACVVASVELSTKLTLDK